MTEAMIKEQRSEEGDGKQQKENPNENIFDTSTCMIYDQDAKTAVTNVVAICAINKQVCVLCLKKKEEKKKDLILLGTREELRIITVHGTDMRKPGFSTRAPNSQQAQPHENKNLYIRLSSGMKAPYISGASPILYIYIYSTHHAYPGT